MSTITTYQRILFDPLNPKKEDISPIDIAHALSLLCRAGGHFAHFYSVAQHCVNCSKEAEARGLSRRVTLGCLLHDASEAYLSDITRPVKAHLEKYLEIEARLQNTIYEKWLAPAPTKEELALIREIDDTLLHHEFYVIMGETVFSPAPTLYSKAIFDFVDFAAVENEYLSLFKLLTDTERSTK